MLARSSRLDIREREAGNAHFLDLVAREATYWIARWRQEVSGTAGSARVEVHAHDLADVLKKAEGLRVDPYLVAFIVIGSEWLCRARPLTSKEIASCQEEMERHVRRVLLDEMKPEVASNLARLVERGISFPRTGRFLISLGEWGTREHAWRRLRFSEARGSLGALAGIVFPAKRGAVPELAPILAGLVVEGAAEKIMPARSGTNALGRQIATVLRGRPIQIGEFGLWREKLSVPLPDHAGVRGESPRAESLREWLIERWRWTYETAFDERSFDWWGRRFIRSRHDWAGFMVQLAHNPFALFGPLVDPDVLMRLYSISWRN